MKKLVKGIVEFRKNLRPAYQEVFAKLALGQKPDALFISCSDSRVAHDVFASTDPGDLFVVRNVGNMIPRSGDDGHSASDESEAAAIEFALENLDVVNVIVCGHSQCGAMQALANGRDKVTLPHLRSWLRHGEESLARLSAADSHDPNLLSKQNVLQQLDNLRSYPIIRQRLAEGRIKLHGWWFELTTSSVYVFDEEYQDFVLIDEKEAQRILKKIEK